MKRTQRERELSRSAARLARRKRRSSRALNRRLRRFRRRRAWLRFWHANTRRPRPHRCPLCTPELLEIAHELRALVQSVGWREELSVPGGVAEWAGPRVHRALDVAEGRLS